MSEMNKPNQNPRDALQALTDNRLETNPNDAFALALRETLPDLSAEKAEKILNRLNKELPTSKGEEITHAHQVARVAYLIEALRDEDKDVRRAAARALQEIEDPSTVPQLIGALKDEHFDVRESAAQALVKIGTPAVPQLIEALKDENGYVRLGAARALGEIGDQSAIKPLKARLPFLGILGGEKDDGVREAIEDAIRKLEGN